MKNILNRYLPGLILISSVACTTGGFNENPQLDKLVNDLAFAPKIVSVTVNGVDINRNTQSLYQLDAKIGDVLNIVAVFESGQEAQLEELQYELTYFSTEIEEFNGIFFEPGSDEDFASAYTFGPVDPGVNGTFEPEDAFIAISGDTQSFENTYTIPPFDDFGPNYFVDPGDFITIHFRVRNSLDNFGYRPIHIHVIE